MSEATPVEDDGAPMTELLPVAAAEPANPSLPTAAGEDPRAAASIVLCGSRFPQPVAKMASPMHVTRAIALRHMVAGAFLGPLKG